MKTLNAERLSIYVNNSSDIYLITESLFNCLAKKIKKNTVPSVEYLSNCSTMRKIIRMAADMVLKLDGEKVTQDERKEVAINHAKYIIECAYFIAEDK